MNKENLSFEQRVAHLKAGYENSQSVVRFIDTKVGLLLGGLTAIFGVSIKFSSTVALKLSENAEKLGKINESCTCLIHFAILVGALTTLAMLCTLFFSYRTLTPRDPKRSPASAIFPYINVEDESDAGRGRVHLYETSTATEKEALEDWANQLERMGEINREKISNCKNATLAFLVFFLFACGYNILLLFALLP